MLAMLFGATALALTTVNPITVTIVAVVCSASLLPFLFLPVLLVANDRELMGELANGKLANTVGPSPSASPASSPPSPSRSCLLDNQLVDCHRLPVGRIDDLQIETRDGEPRVTAMLIGSGHRASRSARSGSSSRWSSSTSSSTTCRRSPAWSTGWRRTSSSACPGAEMRASELIGSPVVDESGRSVGVVRDLQVAVDLPGSGAGFPIVALVVGETGAAAAAAHAWGFAQGRAAGPAVLRRALAPAVERAAVVAAERVLDWGPEPLRIAAAEPDPPAPRRR